ncbi:unnamed protein product [Cuscuta epithymum]|uniref:Ataxin 2 SM domain-containing protein n=1 Tax=Cuscuta epithymum TaxID=186058 RepID=A0AAV0BW46_9ASTE|nr:unnamed protein product [Cuscuta epithymum]
MGCRQGGVAEEGNAAVSDVLLLTTMCIVGLPVDVHVKDGSIYSGIFHTACVDNNYAIVLKKATMVKKGSKEANVTSGNVIETLVILSEDLAQVVAKGITLPSDGIPGHVKGDGGGAVVDDIHSPEDVEREAKSSKPDESNRKRRAQVSKKEGRLDRREITVFHQGQTRQEDQGTNPQVHVCQSHCNALRESLGQSPVIACSDTPIVSLAKLEINQRSAISPSGVPKEGTSVSDVTPSKVFPSSSHFQTDLVPPRSSICNKSAKESKLNPGAKIFRPSLIHQRAVNPPAMQTMAYVPESCHVVPVATPEPEVEIGASLPPRSSLPIKLFQYNNLVAGNGNIDVQYVQPGMGYTGNRTVPRYGSQYDQPLAGTGYMHPITENVTVGHLGPVVYVHPVSHGVVQSTSGFSQVPSCTSLNPLQANIAKHQGNTATQTFPLRVAPPFIAGAQQTYTLPSQVRLSHPSFPLMRLVQIPGSNGVFSSKFA